MLWALDTAALCAVLGAVAGLGVPSLIARVPEPVPESVPESEPRPEPAPVSAELPGRQPSPAEPPVAADGAPAAQPAKEPYAAIAALPGLAWKAALASGAAGALVGLALGWRWQLLPLLVLVPVGVALAVVDWRTRLLPTRVVAPTYVVVGGLAALAGALAGDAHDLVRALWGLVLARGLFWLLWLVYPRGMGFGDVRLAGVLGLALGLLGWGQLVLGVYAGFVLGGVGGLLLARARVVQRRAYPFGPFMLLGALVGVLGGPVLADYYLGRL
jgi:leader peptidase (prepilin peptidase)/N-methyltransferase